MIDSAQRPCHSIGTKPNQCAASHYDRMTYNVMPLYGPWAGWRMAGRDLVSPDRQRISPERLRGLLFRQASEQRLAQSRLRNNHTDGSADRMVESLPARELFAGCA